MLSGEATPEKYRGLVEPWKPGQSGNPAGRPKGSRGKLAEAFIADLYESWQENGKAAIKKVLDERPHEYLKIVASLMPRQVELKEAAFDDLSSEDIAVLVSLARSALPLPDGSGEGTEGEGSPQPAEILSPISEAG